MYVAIVKFEKFRVKIRRFLTFHLVGSCIGGLDQDNTSSNRLRPIPRGSHRPGPGIAGDVIFGDSTELGYAAALPLQDRPFRSAVFSQVANSTPFFTGLALHNPSAEEATLEIEVFSHLGILTGTAVLTIPPGGRLSQLVEELMPETAGQVRGFITVTSNRSLIAQQLFGDGTQLSAVPPTVIK